MVRPMVEQEILPIAHAKKYPASGTDMYMACGQWKSSSTSSKYAAEGTVAHEVASMCLVLKRDADSFLGQTFIVEGYEFIVTRDMAAHVQKYIDYVRDVAGTRTLLVEQRLPIGHITGEADAHGTTDAVVLDDREMIVCDLKFGMGVSVSAENNGQLMMYALGALEEFGLVCDPERVRLVVHQPRIGNVSEWVVSVADLKAFGELVRARTAEIDAGGVDAVAGDKQCRWCAKAATCETLANVALTTIADDFVNLDKPIAPQLEYATERVKASDDAHVANCFAAADLIKLWVKAVEDEARTRLLAGNTLPGFKLVEGRRGNRKWANEMEAELALKAMRVKHEVMYDYSLISPATVEKLVKQKVIGEKRWTKLSALITQSDGAPVVAPASDKRQAIVVDVTGGFDSLPTL